MLSRHTLQGRGRRRPRRKGLAARPSPAAAELVPGRGPARLPVAQRPSDHPAEGAFQEVVLFPANEPSRFASLTFVAQERTFSKGGSFIGQTLLPSLLALGKIKTNTYSKEFLANIVLNTSHAVAY